VRFLIRSDTKERFGNAENEAVGRTPVQFAAATASEVKNMNRMIKATSMRAD